MLGIIATGIHKKINDNQKLMKASINPGEVFMQYYHEGYEAALKEMLQELEQIGKTVQEQIPGDEQ